MKKNLFKNLVYATFFAFGLLTACNNSNNKSENKTHKHEMLKVEYTCPMHPEVVKDEPGKCPKCNMDLVKK